MAGPVIARAVRVEITITETREGQYGASPVASATFDAPLPASAGAIGEATGRQVETLARQVELFRGTVPAESQAVVDG